MPNPPRSAGGGPSAEKLRDLVDAGYTDLEIGEIIGRLRGVEPYSKQAVAYWRQKQGVMRRSNKAPRLDHSAVVPWTIREQHNGDAIQHRLYDYSRQRQGRELAPRDVRLLEEFLEILRRHDLVVDYNPDTEDGWLFRRRDPKIDAPDDIIRRPKRHVVLV